MKSRLVAGVVVVIFVLSMTAAPQAQTPNFQLRLIYPADVQHYDTIAQVMAQQLTPLLVDINDAGSPRPIYLNDLSTFNWDMALLSLDLVSEQYPPLWKMLSPDSFTGEDLYRTNNQAMLQSAGIDNTTKLFSMLDSYQSSSSTANKNDLAHQIQTEYNRNWLLDIPLISTSTIASSWSAFEGYDPQEGAINSLFLGADWSSNPSERVDRDRTTDELHHSIYNYQQIRNPMFYRSRAGFMSIQAGFSSAFLVDKGGQIHPNLVISYNRSVNSTGHETWVLNLRDDAQWSDDTGGTVDATDLKFTYDLATFDWIGSTNQLAFNNVASVDIINSTQLSVTFEDSSIDNKYTLANQYIIPEHVLNQTITVDGQERHPYDGFNPTNTDLWQDFSSNPVTAGPFVYDDEASNPSADIFTKNPDYWSPSINDTPDQVFDLAAGTTQDPYYFASTSEIGINTYVFHISGVQNIDPNTQITTFTSGSRDIVELDILDLDSDLFNKDKVTVEAVPNDGGGLVVLLNLQNRDLQEYDIRKAMTQAIDRQELAGFMGVGQIPQGTPVSAHYGEFYNQSVVIEHDFEAARDTFRQHGYDALEAVTGNKNFEWPWERLPVPIVPLISTFAILAVLRLRRKR